MAIDPRKGRGGTAYQRRRLALKHRAKTLGLVCAWCGGPFDWDAHPQSAGGFTADHPESLASGGHLVHQELAPMHRGCNAAKGGKTTRVRLRKPVNVSRKTAGQSVASG